MSERSEAAQKWAEAKEALEVAQAALDASHTTHNDAVRAEAEAWEALETLSGRTRENTAVISTESGSLSSSLSAAGVLELQRFYSGDHNLKIKPIG